MVHAIIIRFEIDCKRDIALREFSVPSIYAIRAHFFGPVNSMTSKISIMRLAASAVPIIYPILQYR